MMLRSFLVVPAGDPTAHARAAESGADALVVDTVGLAPVAAGERVTTLAARRSRAIWLRLGPPGADETAALLDALMPLRPVGIVLAGAKGGADVTRLSALLRPREAIVGIEDGATRIVALATDTPAGLLALPSYAGASARLAALAWDDEPLAQTLGAEDLSDVARAARTGTLLAAAAAGVAALDRPYRGSNPEALRAEAEAARRTGFAGKLALTAGHVAIINAVFSRTASTSS